MGATRPAIGLGHVPGRGRTPTKIYGLGAKDKVFLNNVYNDLHAKGKL
jgi:hypothetical protein